MKKTVQIVTVPCKQPSYLLKILDNSIANTGRLKGTIEIHDSPWDTDKEFEAQQLLVLSDDVQHGDISYHSGTRTHTYDKYSCTENCKKVIGSYPNIQGTLPLSKETIQEWIDNGTPKKCSVEMIDKDVNQYQDCDVSFGYTIAEPNIDSQGNLILEFDKTSYEIDLSYPEEMELTKKEAEEWCKSITPTDEEIEEKAKIDVDETWMTYEGRPNYKSMLRTFKNGYKQALKDLGYDK